MSTSASATIAFGVDLGNRDYDGWNFDLEDNRLPAEYSGENSLELNELIEEFTQEYAKENIDGELEFNPVALQYGSYGYDFSGTYLFVGVKQGVGYEAQPLVDTLSYKPLISEILTLKKFINFLDSKGLKLKEEFREPQWLVTVLYG